MNWIWVWTPVKLWDGNTEVLRQKAITMSLLFQAQIPRGLLLLSIPGPRGNKPATDCLKFLFLSVTISFRQLNVPRIYWRSLCFDESFLWLRRHFRNDGSHGICGGESGTELNLIALVLALVFLISFFHPSSCQACQPAWRHNLY